MAPGMGDASSRLVELVFENAGAAFCLVAPDGTVLRANAEWLRSTGFRAEQVIGEDIVERFPATRDVALAVHARVRAGHRVELPRYAQTVNGRETWWEGSIDPVPMEGGTGLLITAREITAPFVAHLALTQELTAALSAAHTVEEVAHAVLDKGLSVFGADAATISMRCSETELELIAHYGFPADLMEQWRRFPVTLRTPVTDAYRNGAAVWLGSRAEAASRYAGTELAADGAVYRAWAGVPLVVNGSPLGAIGLAFRDERPFHVEDRHLITAVSHTCAQALDRARLHTQARETARTMETLIETMPVGVVVTDARGEFTLANHEANRIFGGAVSGTAEGPVRGYTLNRIDGAPFPSEELPLLRALRERRVTTGVEMLVRREGASDVAIIASCAPLLDTHGRIRGAVAVTQDITQRKRVEEALRRSEATLDAFFAASPVNLNLFDEGFRYLNCDALTASHFGLDRREMMGQAVEDLIPGYLDRFGAIMRRVLDTGEPTLNVETCGQTPTRPGEVKYGRTSFFPVPLAEGRRGLGVVSVEITDLKNAEAAIRRSEAALANAGKLAHLGAWWIEVSNPDDLAANPLHWSDEVYRIFGYAPGEVEVTNALFFERVHPDDRERIGRAVAAALAEKRPYTIEHRIGRPDGTVRVVREHAEATFDEHGRLARLIGAVQDITDQQRIEHERDALLLQERRARAEAEASAKALAESEARFRAMGETLPYGVWLCNEHGGSQYVSQSYLDLLEMTQEQQREFGWTSRLPPEDVQPTLERWLRCVETGEMWDSEHRVLGPDGKYHYVLTRGLPVRDMNGKIVSWVGINLDIDGRKAMEEELREADRRKDEFLGMLSHELRNPLAPIRNSIYVLDHVEPASERARRARAVILRQTEHLTRLVDDLLDVTRIVRGKIELRRARVDLRDVVRRTAEDFHSALEDRGVGFRTVLPEARVWTDADPTRITQILGNLLHNAAKFTRRGDEVTLSLEACGPEAVIRVRDTGAGIDPAFLPHVFDPFAQGERTLARSEGGLGLGLALVKGIAELHGGTVRAESAGRSKGAEFVVRLPLVTVPPPRDGVIRRVERTSGGRRVLVVDDNADAAESLADIVGMLGHTVEIAYDGPSAVEKARANAPDVVLCDIGLPGMDGYEVAKALRDGGAGAQLFAVSGYAQPEDVRKALEAGFDGHLAKPLRIEDLERLLAL